MTADRIKKDAELLYKNTTALSEEAELMFDRVRNTEGEFKNLFEKTKSNNTLVNEAKEKVSFYKQISQLQNKKCST